MFTSHGFANNGLECRVRQTPVAGVVTGEPSDSGAFKVPTLRNIGFTAPYMHDGRFQHAHGGAGPLLQRAGRAMPTKTVPCSPHLP